MSKKISGCAYMIAFDEINSRFFLLSECSVRVFDLETNEKIATLKDVGNPNQIFISHKNDVIAVKTTSGEFAFYSVKDLSFLGKMSLKGETNTDPSFYYDETENILYGIARKSLKEYFYRVSPKPLQYSLIRLVEMERETKEGDKPITRYLFHRYEAGGFYLVRKFYDVGKHPRIYECSYGRYEEENSALVLKEKYYSTDQCHLELLDVIEKDAVLQINDFCKNHKCGKGFLKSYRNERGLFLITSEAVYRQNTVGAFEEVYYAAYMFDYAEFRGRRYICTGNWCLVQRIQNHGSSLGRGEAIFRHANACHLLSKGGSRSRSVEGAKALFVKRVARRMP